MPADVPAAHQSERTITRTVLRISPSMRTFVVALGVLFNCLMVWLLMFSLARLASIGLAVFIGVVITTMTWVLWKTVQTRMILTDDQVTLKYSFFPTVRVDRASITGVELRNVTYYYAGGGNVYTPCLITSDGQARRVLMMGRRTQRGGQEQTAILRRQLRL